ncbi:MAG: ComEC family competence protein [Chitinophagaceae bacterium]|nr:ComEC family competence protein [Chitinophagaceae bacterium]
MNTPIIPVWKKAPFLRLLLPLIAGIILQWYVQFALHYILLSVICFLIAFILFRFLPIAIRFKVKGIQGFLLQLLIIVFGLFITWQNDIRNEKNWLGNYYTDSNYIILKLNEPLVEKSKSFKAEASIASIIDGDKNISCTGKVLLYFSKDSLVNTLRYGDKILLSKPLQRIKNSGNPGAFNYERYAGFQHIFHNVFLKEKDWVKLNINEDNWFKTFIFNAKEKILRILKSNIKGDTELGVSEALLIGYKEDLDKDLVQAYSNTGVVHIIAISGLHLGLIYVMLLWLFNKIPFIKKSKIVKVIFVLTCLWLFSILTGASASVLRSAVMFTCIVIGENFAKKSSIYNSLAASAFLLLCYNPYFLWDVGFQLSYLAVLGIVLLQPPIYRCWLIKNKWLDKVWKLTAVSLAAQVLTFPVCIYYFHQFPNLFLFTNLVAVPLSSIILFVEIFLIAFAWIPAVAVYIGKVVHWLIWLMNEIILGINKLPFALWDKISANIYSTGLLYAIVIGICAWLLNKRKAYFKVSLVCLAMFFALTAFNSWGTKNQKKLIVYNVPGYQAIDIVYGNNYKFIGDSILLQDSLLQNFHLKPGRISLQLKQQVNNIPILFENGRFLQAGTKKIFILDKTLLFEQPLEKIDMDYIIISKNAKVYIEQLNKIFNCKYYIFDASNSWWRIDKWERDCEQLHLQYYSVPEKGAFEMDLEYENIKAK